MAGATGLGGAHAEGQAPSRVQRGGRRAKLRRWRSSTSTRASATREDARAVHLEAKRAQRADLRRPAARRPAPPLRLPARAERRARLVGGAEGRPARAGPARARGARRGSPARLRDLRGRDPEGQLRRRHGRVWDNGTYELVEEKPDGGLTVRLHGTRLDGTWTLIPAHLDGKEQNWLLMRKRDETCAHVRNDYRPMLATLSEALPDRRRLALRGEVGRLPRARLCARRRRAPRLAERQRPDGTVRRDREGARAGGALAGVRRRRRGVRARREAAARASRRCSRASARRSSSTRCSTCSRSTAPP